ncbi:MAG: preprotein translocase subunit SecG [Clostridia bacterium]|nr:preprotein translocase subunit SecG [Clostridia bacterium]
MNKFINLNSLLAANDAEMPAWVVKSFPTIKIVLAVLICICAIFIIVASLCQKSEAGGSNAITGQADTFYNRNKGESLQGKIKKWTVIASIVILVLCVLFLVVNTIYKGY